MTPKEITTLAGHRLLPPWVMKLVLDVAAAEREACAKESLEVLENLRKETIVQCQEGMIEAYKLGQSEEREKQAEQEPVAWFVQYKNRHEFVFGSKPEFIVDGVVEPLYAAPVNIEAAVLAEREACAKVCEEFGEWRDTSGVDCAAAIRARSKLRGEENV